jgi:hypothetical protein
MKNKKSKIKYKTIHKIFCFNNWKKINKKKNQEKYNNFNLQEANFYGKKIMNNFKPQTFKHRNIHNRNRKNKKINQK